MQKTIKVLSLAVLVGMEILTPFSYATSDEVAGWLVPENQTEVTPELDAEESLETIAEQTLENTSPEVVEEAEDVNKEKSKKEEDASEEISEEEIPEIVAPDTETNPESENLSGNVVDENIEKSVEGTLEEKIKEELSGSDLENVTSELDWDLDDESEETDREEMNEGAVAENKEVLGINSEEQIPEEIVEKAEEKTLVEEKIEEALHVIWSLFSEEKYDDSDAWEFAIYFKNSEWEYEYYNTLKFDKNISKKVINIQWETQGIKIEKISWYELNLDELTLEWVTDSELERKLSETDNDVIEIEDSQEFNITWEGKLIISGRCPSKLLWTEYAFMFPLKWDVNDNYPFFEYELDSNTATFSDVSLEIPSEEYLFYKINNVHTISGHPSAPMYYYVANDDEFLYILTEAFIDNTYDHWRDYSKVYVKTSEWIKTYQVNTTEENEYWKWWFKYTDSSEVYDWQHMEYLIKVPLSVLWDDNKIWLAFEYYGTAIWYYRHMPFLFSIVDNNWYGQPFKNFKISLTWDVEEICEDDTLCKNMVWDLEGDTIVTYPTSRSNTLNAYWFMYLYPEAWDLDSLLENHYVDAIKKIFNGLEVEVSVETMDEELWEMTYALYTWKIAVDSERLCDEFKSCDNNIVAYHNGMGNSYFVTPLNIVGNDSNILTIVDDESLLESIVWDYISYQNENESNIKYIDTKWNIFSMWTITFNDWNREITILDRNLWARDSSLWFYWKYENLAKNGGLSEWNILQYDERFDSSYGYYFQRWNNFWFSSNEHDWLFERGDWNRNWYLEMWAGPKNIEKYSWNNPYVWDIFYKNDNYWYWTDSKNLKTLWWWDDEDVENEDYKKQWPCPEGYHIPRKEEMENLQNTIWNIMEEIGMNSEDSEQSTNFLRYTSLIPLAWAHYAWSYRSCDGIEDQDCLAYLRTSTTSEGSNWIEIYDLEISEDYSKFDDSVPWWGFSLRCFKDESDEDVVILKYETNGWTEIQSQTIKSWEYWYLPWYTSQKTWNVIAEWYSDPDFKNKINFEDWTMRFSNFRMDANNASIDENWNKTITIYAKWIQNKQTWPIKYNENAWIVYKDTTGKEFKMWTISITNWNQSVIMLDRNLWANTNDISSTWSYWYYFQRWNNYWFSSDKNADLKFEEQHQKAVWSWNVPYISDKFVANWDYLWMDSENYNLWWGNSEDVREKQWPCPEWFHVPTANDLELLFWLWYEYAWLTRNEYWDFSDSFTLKDFREAFKIPLSQWIDTWWVTEEWPFAWLRMSEIDNWMELVLIWAWYETQIFVQNWNIPDEMMDTDLWWASVRCFANPASLVYNEETGETYVIQIWERVNRQDILEDREWFKFMWWYAKFFDEDWN